MIESDTRRLYFDNCEFESSAVLGCGGLVTKHLEYNLNWHQTLLAAVFLGAAYQAILEVRNFLQNTRSSSSGQKLSDLDGMYVEIARLYREYHLGMCALIRVGQLFQQLKVDNPDEQLLDHTAYAASMAKTYGTFTAETIVRQLECQ